MQRRKFLLTTSGAIPALTLLPSAWAATQKPFVIKASESRFGVPTPFRGVIPNDLKISSKDTDGTYSFFDYVGIDRVPGPNLHVHLWQDELFYAVDGEFVFQVGTQKIKIGKGDTVYGPRNIQHTWTQLSATGRLVYFVSPAHKMEEFFAQMSQRKGPPTKEESKKIDDEFGILHRGDALQPEARHEYSKSLTEGYVIRAGQSRFNEQVNEQAISPVNLLLSKKDSDGLMSIFDYAGNSKGGHLFMFIIIKMKYFLLQKVNTYFRLVKIDLDSLAVTPFFCRAKCLTHGHNFLIKERCFSSFNRQERWKSFLRYTEPKFLHPHQKKVPGNFQIMK